MISRGMRGPGAAEPAAAAAAAAEPRVEPFDERADANSGRDDVDEEERLEMLSSTGGLGEGVGGAPRPTRIVVGVWGNAPERTRGVALIASPMVEKLWERV